MKFRLSTRQALTAVYVCGMVDDMSEETNKKISASLIKPLAGLRFGKLTVLRFDEIRNHRAYWICLCDCGKEKSITSMSLRPNGSKSCGCGHLGMKSNRRSRPISDRFWEKVEKSDGCWLWTAHVNNMGYGEFHLKSENSTVEYAHRVSWVLHHGDIPADLEILHHCDTPHCVRPDHLFIGTQQDNMRDMVSKGRQGDTGSTGEDHGMAKLTEDDVKEIRRRYIGGVNQFNPSNRRELAKEFGSAPAHVWQIYARKVWTHIP